VVFLIKNNLSVILAERGMKMIEVINATGINKNTISSFANNKATGIQYETLNKLCSFLDVTPGELLSYIKFKIEILNQERIDEDGNYALDVKINLDNVITVEKFTVNITPRDERNLTIRVNMPRGIYSKLSIIPFKHITEEFNEQLEKTFADTGYEFALKDLKIIKQE
jgi:DNA-binding Xre family transcriptional regulator